jgi:hypothetical protein
MGTAHPASDPDRGGLVGERQRVQVGARLLGPAIQQEPPSGFGQPPGASCCPPLYEASHKLAPQTSHDRLLWGEANPAQSLAGAATPACGLASIGLRRSRMIKMVVFCSRFMGEAPNRVARLQQRSGLDSPHVTGQDGVQMPPPGDQHPVQALAPDAQDPPFAARIGPRRPYQGTGARQARRKLHRTPPCISHRDAYRKFQAPPLTAGPASVARLMIRLVPREEPRLGGPGLEGVPRIVGGGLPGVLDAEDLEAEREDSLDADACFG